MLQISIMIIKCADCECDPQDCKKGVVLIAHWIFVVVCHLNFDS